MSTLQYICDMGFSQEQTQRALIATNNMGVESALDWLLENADDDQPVALEETENLSEKLQQIAITETCENTRIQVRLVDGSTLTNTFNAFDQLSAVRLWVQSEQGNEKPFNLMKNFPKKVFTVDEHSKSLKSLDLVPTAVLIVEQIVEPETPQNVVDDAYNYNEEKNERKKLQEQRKREIEEDRSLRDQIRFQIEDDKAARRIRQELKTGKVQILPQVARVQTLPALQNAVSYTNTRIQVRLLNGNTLAETFNIHDSLDAVRLSVQSKLKNNSHFNLMTDFPRRVFSEADYGKSLNELNLVPSALLIVPQARDPEKIRIETGEEEKEAQIQLDRMRMQKEIEEKNRELAENRLARERVLAQIEDDKAAREARWGILPAAPSQVAASPKSFKVHNERKNYTHTTIQVRLGDGTYLKETFSVHDRFSAVRSWVRSSGISRFTLARSIQETKFTENDYDKSLEALGLVPNASLFVRIR